MNAEEYAVPCIVGNSFLLSCVIMCFV